MRRCLRLAHTPLARRHPASVIAAGVAVAILAGTGALGASDATPNDLRPQTRCTPGDSNSDGSGKSDWNCRRPGARVCGPQRDASHTSR
ncbi:hypothetical protein [Streptomyces longispororuber]|uniref:hypothetical protein n=1 Tax=Streptomyces longispororuber TaxID=68230 RepID=UPI0036F7FF98